MAYNPERWGGNAEQRVTREQSDSMRLNEIADGYQHRVEELLSTPAAPAIRNELKQFVKYIDPDAGDPRQYEVLQYLVRKLNAYKSVFADISEDEEERVAFVLALVRHEKSLQ